MQQRHCLRGNDILQSGTVAAPDFRPNVEDLFGAISLDFQDLSKQQIGGPLWVNCANLFSEIRLDYSSSPSPFTYLYLWHHSVSSSWIYHILNVLGI